MNRRRMLDVAVVGGGMVGAAAALALARAGREVVLLEAKQPDPWQPEQPDLRVVALAPDNARWLAELQVWAQMLPWAQPYVAMQVWDAASRAVLRFSAAEAGRAELGWIIENALVADRLWQAMLAQPNLSLRCPARVEQLHQHDDAVEIELEDGGRLLSRLLVAADGAASPLRRLLEIPGDVHDYHQRAVVALLNTELPHAQTCWQRFLPGGPLAFLPFRDGRSSVVWSLPEDAAARVMALDDSAFCAEIERAFDGTLGRVLAASPRLAFPLRRQLAAEYRQGRVVLVGDAAHVVHPLAGQGVNLGLRDVRALLAALDGQTDPGESRPLQRWARRQRSDNAVAAHAFELIGKVTTDQSMLPTLLRGPLLGLANRVLPIKHLLIRQALGG